MYATNLCHRLDACFAKPEREVSLEECGNQCVSKYVYILFSQSYEKSSPIIFIVMTFTSLKAGSNTRLLNVLFSRTLVILSSIQQWTQMIKFSNGMTNGVVATAFIVI